MKCCLFFLWQRFLSYHTTAYSLWTQQSNLIKYCMSQQYRAFETTLGNIWKHLKRIYSHCTVRVAADEYDAFLLFLTTHLYCPESERWTSAISKLWLLFLEDKLNRLFPVTFRSFLFFSQTTLGVGFPTTEQLKVTLSPLTIVTFLGCMEISGATKKNIVIN